MRVSHIIRLVSPAILAFGLVVAASAEWKEQVLYSFQGIPDGNVPYGGVVFDKAGNLYGTTGWGGSKSCNGPTQCGIVFQLQPQQGGTWTENILYTFKGAQYGDGDGPQGGLIIDSAGNLYGTTAYGGTGNCQLFGTTIGCGTVFEMSPPQRSDGAWSYAILYSFQGDKDGQWPTGNLTFDKAGNLYGATQHGGGKGHNNCNTWYPYCGTVFRLSPPKHKGGAWTEKVLYSFRSVGNNQESGDGALPNGGLVLDSEGAIYGTTYMGGNNKKGTCRTGQGGTGCGTAFKLSPPTKKGGEWTEKLIHVFRDGSDCKYPAAGLAFDAKGQLFGTTVNTVFRLTRPRRKPGQWKFETIYTFGGDGSDPNASVIFDAKGSLYGTTLYSGGGDYAGTVYRLTPPSRHGGNWTYELIYGFEGPPDGGQPGASLTPDNAGNMYSTTWDGGTSKNCSHGCGTVFEVSP